MTYSVDNKPHNANIVRNRHLEMRISSVYCMLDNSAKLDNCSFNFIIKTRDIQNKSKLPDAREVSKTFQSFWKHFQNPKNPLRLL